MKKIIIIFLFAANFCFSQNNISEQKQCGSYKIDNAAFANALKWEAQNKTRSNPSYYIRVFFHVCRYNDGSHAVITEDELKVEFDTLVSEYAANNICFINEGWDFVNSTKLDTNFNGDTGNWADFDPYRAPNCINIFYVQQIKGNNPASGSGGGGYGGITDSLPGTISLVTAGNIGWEESVAHEVGHCFGLLHTFESGNGYEDIDGSNSSTTADLITDTPADPWVHKGDICFSQTSCFYSGSCKDPKNRSDFSPPYKNLMAYWNCSPNLKLTQGQYNRVNSFLSTAQKLINCESPSNLVYSSSVSSGKHMESATNTITTSGSPTISGTANVSLGATTVTLSNGFHANPSSGGNVEITTPKCK